MDKLPTYYPGQPAVSRPQKRNKRFKGLLTAIVLAIGPLAYLGAVTFDLGGQPAVQVPVNAEHIKGRCHSLNLTPGPPSNFLERTESDRFEPGTKPVLVKNATIWTGRADGLEVVKGDVFLANGLVKAVGDVDESLVKKYKDVKVVDAKGAWVTPGYVAIRCP